MSEDDLSAARRVKLAQLRESGFIYPNRFRPENHAADLQREHAEEDAERLEATLGDVLGDEERRRRLGEVAAERALSFEYERALGVYANGLRKLAGETELAPEQRRPRWEEES